MIMTLTKEQNLLKQHFLSFYFCLLEILLNAMNNNNIRIHHVLIIHVKIKLVQQPFLWIHGTADDYLDFENHGQVVFDNYQGTRGVAVPVQGANHGNVPAVMGIEPYRHAMLDFLLDR